MPRSASPPVSPTRPDAIHLPVSTATRRCGHIMSPSVPYTTPMITQPSPPMRNVAQVLRPAALGRVVALFPASGFPTLGPALGYKMPAQDDAPASPASGFQLPAGRGLRHVAQVLRPAALGRVVASAHFKLPTTPRPGGGFVGPPPFLRGD